MKEGICLACGERKQIVAFGWCDRDYRRWRKHGDPLAEVPVGGPVQDVMARFEAKVDRLSGPDACHPWKASQQGTGYGVFWFNGKWRTAHAVAWELVNGPVPAGLELDHECHNRAVREGTCQPGLCPHRLCCNERHLTPKTRREHTDDTERPRGSGLNRARGSAHPQAKLTEADIPLIRAALANGEAPRSISLRYGVTEGLIRHIKHGRAWKHVTSGAN